MIKTCVCDHAGQDAMYGKGNRVHNRCKPSNSEEWVRCTVCNKESIVAKKEKDKAEKPVKKKK